MQPEAGRQAMAVVAFAIACAVFGTGVFSATARAADGVVAFGGMPYAGFMIGEDEAGHVVVRDVIAGPAALAGLLPGDRIEAVEGVPMTAATLLETLRASTPGTKVALRVGRDGALLEVVLVVGNLADWAWPAAYPSRVPFAASPPRTGSNWMDRVNDSVHANAPELDPVDDRLQAMFEALARDDKGYNRSRLNRQVLADPAVLVDWDRRLVAQLEPVAQARDRIVVLLCELLGIECAGIHHSAVPSRTLADFTQAIAGANQRVRDAFRGQPREDLLGDLRYLLEQTAAQRTLLDRANALKGIRAMQASMRVDTPALLDAFDALIVNASRLPEIPGTPRRDIPPALSAMVQGDILDYAEVDGGYVVVGGAGPNVYRMDRLYAVIDVGGDDRYVWGEALPLETQTVIDLAGNDRYEASFGGPGAGWMGVSVLVDHGGNDEYVGALGSCGAGAFGFGLLVDRAGDDTYRCDRWSTGAGIYGAGVLIDEAGTDTYISQSLSQGVGGPAGVGLLVDGAGNDLYRANGPVESAYGTPGSFMAFSQGIGFGIRPYDHGGFGALVDLAGDDRYEGGEFSQGGGYFWGVGLLHDGGGNDLYYGSRYAQGFAAHQAAGLLVDVSGDDVYWATQAAAQGAAWDQSVAMLYDGGGNDFYRAESLAQGAAAQQSRAWLFDAGGNDVYWAAGDSQGAAGDNSYHFLADDPVVSLGVLFDAGGDDRYSSGLADGGVRIRHRPGDPDGGRGNAGVAIDLAP